MLNIFLKKFLKKLTFLFPNLFYKLIICFLFYKFFIHVFYLNIFIQVNWYELFSCVYILYTTFYLNKLYNIRFRLNNCDLDLT